MQFKQVTAASILLLLSISYATPAPQTTGQTVGNVIDNTINTVTNTINNWHWPTITVPDSVSQLITNMKNSLQSAPQEFWQEIKNNTWPQDVQNWINSLPSNMQSQAKQELLDLANEHLGNGTNTTNTGSKSSSDAPLLTAATMFTVASIAGIVAAFMTF